MGIFSQLGELFLQALPTTIIVFLFFLFMRGAFFQPIERVLAERNKRIEGARKGADAAQAAAQEKVRSYQEALKKARGELYTEQDAARRAVLDERAWLIKQTRDKANEGIRAAKDRIAGEVAAARRQLEQESQTLGSEIARAILRTGPSAPAAGDSR